MSQFEFLSGHNFKDDKKLWQKIVVLPPLSPLSQLSLLSLSHFDIFKILVKISVLFFVLPPLSPLSLLSLLSLSHFDIFKILVKISVFELSQIDFFNIVKKFNYVTIRIFGLWHNFSFWVLSQFEFLSFVTIWLFKFCHN